MFSKKEVKKVILEIMNLRSDDVQMLDNLIIKIDNMNQEEFEEVLKKNNILNRKDINSFIQTTINREKSNRPEEKFKKLNKTVGYGITGETLHLHVMPTELKDALSKSGRKMLSLELIEALEKVQILLSEDKNCNDIKQVYAVSSILRGPILDIFKNLKFDTRCIQIKDAKEDNEFAKFYETFKSGKYIGSASLFKDKMLSKEWIENKDKIRDKLKQELGIEDTRKENKYNSFIAGLKGMVNNENNIITNDNKKVLLNRKKEFSKEENIK